MKLHFHKSVFSFIFLCLCIFVSAQYTIPEKPKLLYPVYDEAKLLSKQETDELNKKLIAFSDSTSTEIEVVIIPSTKGEDINFVATMIGEKWGIGQKGIDNGVVFLIATEDRKLAIQQGRAVEQYLTASVSKQIIDYIVTPHFREGNWYEGINRGTSAIMEAVQGKFKPIERKKENDFDLGQLLLVAFVIIIILIIIFKNRGGGNDDDDDVIITRRGRRNYPGGFFPFPFPGSFGGGGFGGGSSSGGGGGFGGFGGGGSFGGGGASGGW
ncbi:TPM domain-containing protein [Chryseobacterium sp. Leaf394]|uniref:TPM domain-containing protein n=1 Tax=Chryseobacterium sp. Leaf394 TaxID=1736361 RepID=UPI000702219E|nr:TPM domain-containing protein [Chryseobacterium sp. Leaf394]KQS94164.1 methanol dehydrogenase [Chryseobacterium sp. Leaf394]